MNTTIRAFTPDDYAVLVQIGNACFPDNPSDAAEMRRHDDIRDAKCLRRRFIAESGGIALGYASYGHLEWMYHSNRFEMIVCVNPAHRNRGVGTALYEAITEDMAPLNPEVLRAFAREDMEPSCRFLDKRGFSEEERYWESRLDVTSFDPSGFPSNEERLRGEGVRLTTFGQLAADPNRDVKMHALETELVHDLPAPEPHSDLTYEQYRNHILESPNLLPEGITVAVHGDEYIGLSALWKSNAHSDLETGLTAVKRPWRRHGIALAMKLRAIDYGRKRGYAVIRTDNNAINRAMLSINERLGFVKLPVWIGYAKTMK